MTQDTIVQKIRERQRLIDLELSALWADVAQLEAEKDELETAVRVIYTYAEPRSDTRAEAPENRARRPKDERRVKGAVARSNALSPERWSEIAKLGASARWGTRDATPTAPPSVAPKKIGPNVVENAETLRAALPILFETYPNGVSSERVQQHTGLRYDHALAAIRALASTGDVVWVNLGGEHGPNKYMFPAGTVIEEPALPKNQQAVIEELIGASDGAGNARLSVAEVSKSTGLTQASAECALEALTGKGVVERLPKETGKSTVFRISNASELTRRFMGDPDPKRPQTPQEIAAHNAAILEAARAADSAALERFGGPRP